MNRRVGTVIAVLAGFALLGFGASQLLGSAQPVAPDLAVQQRLMCPQCQGVRLDVCDRPVCVDMRSDIRRRLARGENADAIVGDYQVTYGPAVLAAAGSSTSSGLVPWFLVALGVVLLIGLAARVRGVPPGRASSDGPVPGPASWDGPAPGPASRAAAASVDRELAAWRDGR